MVRVLVKYSEKLYYEEEIVLDDEKFAAMVDSALQEFASPELQELYNNDFSDYLKSKIRQETNLTDFLTFSPKSIVDSDDFYYDFEIISE